LIDCIPVPGRTEPGSKLGSIRGIVPALVGDLDGCMFRNRCDLVSDACRSGDIGLIEISAGRAYRCHLSPDESKIKTSVEGAV